jgi:hypothetical protein
LKQEEWNGGCVQRMSTSRIDTCEIKHFRRVWASEEAASGGEGGARQAGGGGGGSVHHWQCACTRCWETICPPPPHPHPHPPSVSLRVLLLCVPFAALGQGSACVGVGVAGDGQLATVDGDGRTDEQILQVQVGIRRSLEERSAVLDVVLRGMCVEGAREGRGRTRGEHERLRGGSAGWEDQRMNGYVSVRVCCATKSQARGYGECTQDVRTS